jgi:SmpA / OmlA family
MRGRAAAPLVIGLGLAFAACRHGPAPALEVPQQFQGRTVYVCCDLHYAGDDIDDANYWVGKIVPAGTPITIEKLTKNSVTFSAGDVHLTLTHQYGAKEETFFQYLGKVFVTEDPRPRIARYRPAVQRAIEHSKVEHGMTREQVLASLGYPPTHRTPSTKEREWTYWYNRWVTYKVVFDEAGKVTDVVGRPAPTAEAPIEDAATSAPEEKKRVSRKHKKK